jgi:hypothetical protein
VKPRVHHKLISWGFGLGFFAVIGSLFAMASPFLDAYQRMLIHYVLLAPVIGLGGIAVAKLTRYEAD